MKEWLVRLKGERFDLLALSKMLTSIERTVMEENGQFYLKSSEFKLLNEADAVYYCATDIIHWINLIAKVVVDGFKSVNLDVVTLVHENGSRQNFIFESCQLSAQSRIGFITLDSNNLDLEYYISLAKKDAEVDRAFRYFGSKGQRWVNLFNVYDVIKADVGGEKNIIKNGWISNTKLRLFRRTANNPRAIGDEARHGHEKSEPPSSPMSLSEAESLIRTLLIKWTNSKC